MEGFLSYFSSKLKTAFFQKKKKGHIFPWMVFHPGRDYYVDLSDVADIDECEVFGEQLCSQICVNTVGSFRCECRQGYTLAQDERTCVRQSKLMC